MVKAKKKINRNMTFWFPRLSAIFFCILTFFLILPEVYKVVYLYPMALEFITAIMVMMLTYLVWNDSKKAGIYFIIAGLLFAIFSIKRLLIVSVLFASIWLILTGLLFFVEYINSESKKVIKAPKENKKAEA